MTVDEKEPEAAAPPQREHIAEQDAAVTAQDQGVRTRVEDGAHHIGKRRRVVPEAGRVEDAGRTVDARIERRDGQTRPASSAKALGKARAQQRLGKALDPFSPQAEV